MKKVFISFLLLLVLVGVSAKPKTDQAKLKGQVYEMVDGKKSPLPFSNLMIKGTVNGTVAGIEGDYSMELEKGEYTIVVSCYGYEPLEKTIKIRKKTDLQNLDLALKPAKDQIALQ